MRGKRERREREREKENEMKEEKRGMESGFRSIQSIEQHEMI